MTVVRPSRADAVIEIELDDGGLVFLSDYAATRAPGTIARLEATGNPLWTTAPNDPGDWFIAMTLTEGMLTAQTWAGYACRVRLSDGEIEAEMFVK